MANIVTLDRNMSPLQRSKTLRGKPRSGKRLLAGWISDLIALRRSIALCWRCEMIVEDRVLTKAGYVNRRNLPYVAGPCDGCQDWMPRGKLWVHRNQLPK